MRRTLLTATLMLLAAPNAYALDLRPDLVERCPRLSNPIECRERDNDENDSRRHDHDREGSGRSFLREREEGVRKLHRQEEKRCERYRFAYRMRHPGRAPESLREHRGCDRWRIDYNFHSGRTMGNETGLEALRARLGDVFIGIVTALDNRPRT